MLEENRTYRKKLTSQGLIYLGGQEIEISVKNLSISGLLAILEDSAVFSDIKKVFKVIQGSPIIDIYLKTMRIAGEAEIVRVDQVGNEIQLAIEFRNVFHDVGDLLYKRKAYRKDMTAPGQIIFYKKKYTFHTKNVSVDGLMIHLEEIIDVEEGTITILDFKRLNLRGVIKVVWKEYIDNVTFMGLQYLQMEREDVGGIPRFYNESE